VLGQAHRLSAAAGQDRPLLSNFGVRHRAAQPLVTLRRFRAAKHADIHDAQHAIEAVGLDGFEHRPIDTLSVGQFQRVLFARLLQDADLVLLDEPFAAIDSKTVADLMAVIQRWRAEKRTVVAVLHDLEQVRRDFPNALLLARELVDAGPTARVLSVDNLLRAAPWPRRGMSMPTPAMCRRD
jgi:zinc/manganese transport system ATP-binding protein